MFFSKPNWAPVLVAIAAVPMAGTLLLDSVELSSAAPSENCSPADCNDRNPCTDDELVFCACRFQICAPVCEHTAISGKRCHDDNPCTTDDACFSGACVGARAT